MDNQLSRKDAATRLHISESRISQMIHDGKLSSIRGENNQVFIPLSEIEELEYSRNEKLRAETDIIEFICNTDYYPNGSFFFGPYKTEYETSSTFLLGPMASLYMSFEKKSKLLNMIRSERLVHYQAPPVRYICDDSGEWYFDNILINKVPKKDLTIFLSLGCDVASFNAEIPECWDMLIDHWKIDPEIAYKWIVGTILGIPTNKILYLWGTGGTGKSVFQETMKYILADMMIVVNDSDAINRNDAYYLAQLEGKRLLSVAEHSKQNLGSAFKFLSGNDTITARHPYGRPFQFHPTHRLLVVSNEPPAYSDIESAFSRRLITVETVKPKSLNRKLLYELKETAPQFLAFLLDKYVDICADIEDVENDTQAIQTDSVQMFLKEQMQGDIAQFNLRDTYNLYRGWCETDAGVKPASRETFKIRALAANWIVTAYDPHIPQKLIRSEEE